MAQRTCIHCRGKARAMLINLYALALTTTLIATTLSFIVPTYGVEIAATSPMLSASKHMSSVRGDDSILLPSWENGNKWVYTFEMHGYSPDISNMVVSGTISYTVQGTETVTIAGNQVESYKVYYERIFNGNGNARSTVNMNGQTTGYEYYSTQTLELVKSEYNTFTSGTGTEGGFSVSFVITDDSTSEETTLGDFYAFPIDPSDTWSSYSVISSTSHTVTDYTPDGGFYPDDSDVTKTVTITHDMSSITSGSLADKGCSAGTFSAIEVTAQDQWSRSDGLSNTGTIKRYFAKDVGNAVYITMANVYDFGFTITSGWMDLNSYDYTYTPPPEYGFNAYATPSEASVRPGESADFTLSVWNYGGFDDTIDAEVLEGGSGWLTLSLTSISLNAGGTGTITATVSVPAEAIPGTYVDNIQFTSEGDSTKTSLVTIKTNVLENMPPEIKSMSPKTNFTQVGVNESITFSLSLSDPDNDPITVQWYLDGEFEKEGTTLTLEFNTSGNHTIRAEVTDGRNVLNVTWSLEVLPPGSDRAPEIIYYSPAAMVVREIERTYIDFTVHAVDPEGGSMDFIWSLDDETIATSSAPDGNYNSTHTLFLETRYRGKWHKVRCDVSDGKNTVGVEWDLYVISYSEMNFTLTNLTPPEFNLLYPRGRSITFGFEVLNYTYPYYVSWFLDDSYVEGWADENHITINTTTIGDGRHKIFLVITPKYGSDYYEYTWNLTVATDLYPSPTVAPPNTEEVVINLGEEKAFKVTNPREEDAFTWYVDGEEDITSKSYTYRYKAQTPGEHTLTLRVRNRWGNYALVNWSIKVTDIVNNPPSIDDFYPPRSVILYENDTLTFKVSVSDEDGLSESLTITWLVDGTPHYSGTEYLFRAEEFKVGEHEVEVEVSDGKFTTKKEWHVVIEGEGKSTQGMDVASPPRALCYGTGLIIFILLVSIGYVAYIPESRRKRKEKVELHCPVCMAFVNEEWKRCPICGSALDLRCKGCGSPILSEWHRCPVCHKALTPSERGMVVGKGGHGQPPKASTQRRSIKVTPHTTKAPRDPRLTQDNISPATRPIASAIRQESKGGGGRWEGGRAEGASAPQTKTSKRITKPAPKRDFFDDEGGIDW